MLTHKTRTWSILCMDLLARTRTTWFLAAARCVTGCGGECETRCRPKMGRPPSEARAECRAGVVVVEEDIWGN